MTAVAAIDGGKSGLRIRVATEHGEVDGSGPGFVYAGASEDDSAVLTAVNAAVAEARGRLQGDSLDRLEAVAVGLTGIPGDPHERRALRMALESTLTAPVTLVDDALLAHAGAVAGPGTVVSAGTGTIVLAISEDGESRSFDGWGPSLGDRGSAHAIGLAGMRAATAAQDRVGPATRLVVDLADALGGDTSLAALQRFYRSDSTVVLVSSFAVRVAQAAENGDKVAKGILAGAAQDLAATIAVAAAHAPQQPISYAGRLLHENSMLRGLVATRLDDVGLILGTPLGDALAGGIRLARGVSGVPEMAAYQRVVDGWGAVPAC
ncbi:N-acetylglucosamine kinase-like BadF-type ATPase [Microbacterium trichothecenolyticum]|jgi:N-acetylglucosamine kinase-like BadF-type ATPase|uniref:N-acetylglucosamine kinase n=1 Tax=Microbacterium trichothecenolyticum TaxID=69370 RepID=UPI0028656AD3|nr:BadF/BadG/BcrA/BcrD ATPase family protein [Microbacterium trichothecenolyticum]MDR7184438.1 N-acetylglucosamine kinase-like BadF-type ATPase [Microbacterium trichothecenolyticum]